MQHLDVGLGDAIGAARRGRDGEEGEDSATDRDVKRSGHAAAGSTRRARPGARRPSAGDSAKIGLSSLGDARDERHRDASRERRVTRAVCTRLGAAVYNRTMVTLRIALAALVAGGLATIPLLAGCHLADSPEPPTCVAGAHPFEGRCVSDDIDATAITITAPEAGAPCDVVPETITVSTSGRFEFHNDDAVDHVIAGADGVAWVTAKAGQTSSYVGITKVGRWPYTVSGCAEGGTVVVE
jgi:hypothetical protein